MQYLCWISYWTYRLVDMYTFLSRSIAPPTRPSCRFDVVTTLDHLLYVSVPFWLKRWACPSKSLKSCEYWIFSLQIIYKTIAPYDVPSLLWTTILCVYVHTYIHIYIYIYIYRERDIAYIYIYIHTHRQDRRVYERATRRAGARRNLILHYVIVFYIGCIYIYIYTQYIYIYVCIYMYIHIHICIHITNKQLYIYIYIYAHIHLHIYTYIYTYIHIHIHMHLLHYLEYETRPRAGRGRPVRAAVRQRCVYLDKCMYISLYIYIYIYILYIYTHRYVYVYMYVYVYIYI